MKAYVLQGGFGLDHLHEMELEIPSPRPGQVLIRMKAVSLNARDIGVIDGFYEPNRTAPLIPVSDGVGEVVAVGESAGKFELGARVSPIFTQSWTSGEPTQANWVTTLGSPLDGLLAEYAVFPEEALVRVPAYLTDEEAATLPCAAVTAWHALAEEGRVRPGDTIVVQGTGGVSLFALQFAKQLGARVIITSSSDDKLERAKALGADYGINYRTNPEWDTAVLAYTEGVGADHIIDLGGGSTLNRSVAALKVGGQISIVGILSGAEVEGFSIIPALLRKARLQAINVGSRVMFERMNGAIEQYSLRPVIDRTFSYGQSLDALRYLAKGTAFGKICIVF